MPLTRKGCKALRLAKVLGANQRGQVWPNVVESVTIPGLAMLATELSRVPLQERH